VEVRQDRAVRELTSEEKSQNYQALSVGKESKGVVSYSSLGCVGEYVGFKTAVKGEKIGWKNWKGKRIVKKKGNLTAENGAA